MLFYSSLVSAVFLFLVIIFQGKARLLKESFAIGSHQREKGPSSRDLGCEGPSHEGQSRGGGFARGEPSRGSDLLRSAANAFLSPFLYYVILFKAYSLLPAQEAQPLNFTWPIMLVLLSAPMLGQRIRALSILALLISFLGVLIVSTHGHLLAFRFTNVTGAILAVGSAIVWALFWLTNVRDNRDEVLKLFLNFFFGFIYILITTVILGPARNAGFYAHIGTPGLCGSAYVGIFEMGAAFVLWLNALRLSEATAKVSNLIFLSPFVSLLFIRFVVGERILLSSVVGLGFIAAGIILQQATKGGRAT